MFNCIAQSCIVYGEVEDVIHTTRELALSLGGAFWGCINYSEFVKIAYARSMTPPRTVDEDFRYSNKNIVPSVAPT
jgi:hypothetical protein